MKINYKQNDRYNRFTDFGVYPVIKKVSFVAGITFLGMFLLGGCNSDSTSMTSLGEFDELSDELQESMVENRDYVDREDYYGKWYSSVENEYGSSEVWLEIDENYVTDTYSGNQVEYKYNKKSNEIIIETEEMKELYGDDDIIDGNIALMYNYSDEDGETILETANPRTEGNEEPTPMIGNYTRTEWINKII